MQIKDLNINALFNLTSAAVVVFGYMWASLANNKRMDDFSKRMDDLRDRTIAEMRAMRNELLAEMKAGNAELRGEIGILSNRMGGVEKRLDRIEGQLEHPIVHPR